ncbi:kinase-like domain, phloem protein 2-like protein [Tanacetum coccineum]
MGKRTGRGGVGRRGGKMVIGGGKEEEKTKKNGQGKGGGGRREGSKGRGLWALMPMFRIYYGGKKFPPILLHRVRVHDSCAGVFGYSEENVKHLRIPVSEIESATKKYLGSGTYGKVYAADLEVSLDKSEIPKKRTVAIKCIEDSKPGKEGFYTEIELLTSCKHPNIVSLLGFCNDGPNMILVFEYASNKSLDNYLGGSTDNSINLTWIQRLKICIDIARGLNYLHTRDEDDEKKIVHRDLKSGNVLLGDNWVAKIADFGLSKFNRVDEEGKTYKTNTIAGTEVYMCPEYRRSGRLKREIDIYSLGVVLLEILSGKLAYDDEFIEENDTGIAHVARRRLKEGTINGMVDQKIMEEVDELTSTLNKGPNQDSLKTFIEIAHKCIEKSQDKRPTAKEVMEELQEALLIQEKNKDNLRMSFADVESATEKFSSKNLIGEGGFGPVYKGKVGINAIAAKRLKKRHGQGERHFLTELEILFDYKHENIIRLEGYCNEKDEKIIVYEFASERSLDRHLKKNSLTWIKRLQICIDVACGLAYLHGGAQTNEMVIHRDIKSANILLNGDWKAKISDFGLSSITTINQEDISNLVGTNGYLDPVYEETGFFTEKSDIYSFGVVLFEILFGQLVAPDTKNYDQNRVDKILKNIHNKENLDFIVFLDIKRQIAPESLSTFREIVSQCLQHDRTSRPTAKEVLQQLKKAMEFQEEYEIWQPKLPKDYKEIIQMSKSPEIYSTKNNEDLYHIFSKGILLPKDKVLFSLANDKGEINEMISARKFSYMNPKLHKWRTIRESRFKKVAKMLDISDLNIQVQIKTKFLSPGVTYGVHLVFKFCDWNPVASKPMYVNLTYKMGGEKLHAYFATSRDDKWLMIELCEFSNHKEDNDFTVLLEGFSRYYRGNDAIYVEGIEFRAMDKASVKKDKPKEVQSVLESDSMDNVQKLPTDCDDIIKRSSQSVRDSSKEELYSLLINWILIDDDEKLLSLSKRNGKKSHMLPVKAVLCDSSNVKLFALRDSVHSRFHKEVELLSPPQFRIQCKIESRLLSSDTKYKCYLVFKISEKCRGLHYPVRVRDQRHRKNKVVGILYLRSPSQYNLHDTFRVPEQREDGWMEVNVWEFNTDSELKDVPMDLKILSYGGTMRGLILYGIEFRPM